MESIREGIKTYEEYESEEEYQKRCAELQSAGFEECNTHSNFTEEEIDQALLRMLEESIQTKKVMIGLRHQDKLTIWVEHPFFSDPEIISALTQGYTMSILFPPNRLEKMKVLLKTQYKIEGRDYLIIPVGDKLTLWMKTEYTNIRIDLRAEILKVITNIQSS